MQPDNVRQPSSIFLIANSFKTQEMCIKGVQVDTCRMKDVPDHFKTQEMCNKAVVCSPYELRFVPDGFVTQQQIGLRDGDNDYYDNNEIIKWYKVYKQRKTQKAKNRRGVSSYCLTSMELVHVRKWEKETEKLWK